MQKNYFLQVLYILNYFIGTVVVLAAFYLYITKGALIPLYIALAIIIAGPIESLLNIYINNYMYAGEKKKKYYISIVDNVTSLAFLIFLGLAVWAAV